MGKLVLKLENQNKAIMISVKFIKGPSLYSGSQANHWKNREIRNLADNISKKERENCDSDDLLVD